MKHNTSGYCDCACHDCFDLAIASIGDTVGEVFCWDCAKAGCESTGDCKRSDAYADDDAVLE